MFSKDREAGLPWEGLVGAKGSEGEGLVCWNLWAVWVGEESESICCHRTG